MNIPTKRWRGYYRALKRGESWAVELSKKSPLNRLFIWVYGNAIEKLVRSENPLLKLLPKQENNLYHQPVILGVDFTLAEFIKTTKE